jgi:F-type H+-transporting ATPase subunit delta
MLVEAVAERYSEALFSLARDKGQVAEIGKELDALLGLLASQPALAHALAAPNVPDEVKKNIVMAVFAKKLSPLMVNFLVLLVERRRGEAIEAVVREYHALVREAENKVKVDVEVAVDLPANAKQTIQDTISKATGKTAILEWHTNPAILGGVVVRIKDTLIDYSLRTQLLEMRDRLVKVG